MPFRPIYSATLIFLLAWPSLASGQEEPKTPGTSDLPPGVRWLQDKDAAPFLIMHGDEDGVVPLSQSVKLAEALKRAGVEVTLRVYKGSGHGGSAFTSPESWRLIEDFFARHLRAEKPVQRQPVRACMQGLSGWALNYMSFTSPQSIALPEPDTGMATGTRRMSGR